MQSKNLELRRALAISRRAHPWANRAIQLRIAKDNLELERRK